MDTLVPKALMIRWSLHPFLITLTGALPFCPTTLKNAQRILDHVLVDVPGDEDDTCAVIIAGPCVQLQGRMEDVLHAVNDYWPRWLLDHVDNAFYAQEIVSAHRAHQIKPFGKSRP